MSEQDRPRPGERSDKIKVTPNLSPGNEDLFEWVERLFTTPDEFPLKIELHQVYGRGCSQITEGVLHLWQKKPNQQKPTKEEIVGITQEFAAKAQIDCNAIGRPQRYGVFAFHPLRASSWYDRKILPLRPRDGIVPKDSDLLEDGEGGTQAQRMIEIELDHIKVRERDLDELSQGYVGRLEKRVENLETRCDQYSEKVVGMADRFVDQMGKVADQFTKLMGATEAALDRSRERAREDRREKFKIGLLERGAKMIEGVAPAIVNAAVGQKILPEPKSLVAQTVEAFLNGMDQEQRDAVLGRYDDTGKALAAGVLTPDQAALFLGIGDGTIPDSRVDDLLDGGRYEITTDQFARAFAVLRPDQYAGIAQIGMQRKAAREKAKAQAEIESSKQ